MAKIKIVYLWVYLILFSGCSHKEDFILFHHADDQAVDPTTPLVLDSMTDNVIFEYKVVPHDRALLIVYNHPEFSPSTLGNRTNDRGVLINAKGEIRLPLVKSIHVAGLTQTEAQEKIEEAFRHFIKSPDIYFEVLNKRAYVVGEVNRPGEIELPNEQLNLLQVLARAGDLKESANRKKVMILRPKGDSIHSQMVNLVDFNSLRNANLTIRPNDVVYVLPNDMKAFNVKVDEMNPIFRLIGNALSPFITIKVLSN